MPRVALYVILVTTPFYPSKLWLSALFCDPLGSRFLSRVGHPTGCFNSELLCVLGGQSLPTAELMT
jgi:hypothetical protein